MSVARNGKTEGAVVVQKKKARPEDYVEPDPDLTPVAQEVMERRATRDRVRSVLEHHCEVRDYEWVGEVCHGTLSDITFHDLRVMYACLLSNLSEHDAAALHA